MVPQQQLPSPTNWGWEKTQDGWMPKQTTLPEASTACNELLHCGCKKSYQGLWKCFRAKLKCTFLCACAGHCSRRCCNCHPNSYIMLIVLYYIIYGKDDLSFQLFILLQLLNLMVSMCQSNVILWNYIGHFTRSKTLPK